MINLSHEKKSDQCFRSSVPFSFVFFPFHLYEGGRVGVGVDRSEAWFLSNVFNRLKLCLSSSKTTYFVCLLASSVWFENLSEKAK